MVFANIYTKLNDLEQKVNALSTASGISLDNSSSVDLSLINEKLTTLDAQTSSLNEKISGVTSKLDDLPSEYVSPQDVSSLFEKVNQVTNILAQFNMQINKITERISTLEQKSAEE